MVLISESSFSLPPITDPSSLASFFLPLRPFHPHEPHEALVPPMWHGQSIHTVSEVLNGEAIRTESPLVLCGAAAAPLQ